MQTGRQTNILWPDTNSASQTKIYSPMISCTQSLIQCPTNSTLIPPELITLFSSCVCSVMANSLQPHGPTTLLCPWNFPGKNPGVGSISYSRGSSSPRDQTCASCFSCTSRRVLYHLYHLGNLFIFIISISFLLYNFVLM